LVYFETFDDIENAIRWGKAFEEMESGLEGSFDRRNQSELG
jgi:hypothetical protein